MVIADGEEIGASFARYVDENRRAWHNLLDAARREKFPSSRKFERAFTPFNLRSGEKQASEFRSFAGTARELLPFNPYLAFTLRLPSYAVQLLRETFPPPAIYPNPPGNTSSLSRRYERASPSSSSTGARAPSGILAASIVGSGAFPPLRCLQTFERLRQTVKSVPAENSR